MGSKRLILFADDNEPMRRLVRAILEPEGYVIMTSADGDQALENFRENADDISLVMLDNQMPGLSGHEVLVEIRKQHPELPVLIASGFDNPGTGSEDQHLSYLSKPYMPADLSRKVRELIG